MQLAVIIASYLVFIVQAAEQSAKTQEDTQQPNRNHNFLIRSGRSAEISDNDDEDGVLGLGLSDDDDAAAEEEEDLINKRSIPIKNPFDFLGRAGKKRSHGAPFDFLGRAGKRSPSSSSKQAPFDFLGRAGRSPFDFLGRAGKRASSSSKIERPFSFLGRTGRSAPFDFLGRAGRSSPVEFDSDDYEHNEAGREMKTNSKNMVKSSRKDHLLAKMSRQILAELMGSAMKEAM